MTLGVDAGDMAQVGGEFVMTLFADMYCGELVEESKFQFSPPLLRGLRSLILRSQAPDGSLSFVRFKWSYITLIDYSNYTSALFTTI